LYNIAKFYYGNLLGHDLVNIGKDKNMHPLDDFSSLEFDQWAETYDASISVDQFPFWGYKILLDLMVDLADIKSGMSVLDLGTGTANLAVRFAALGCDLWCTDFSRKMLDIARQKLPNAHYALHNLVQELPIDFDRSFDRIVSAYVFHHFKLDQKLRILSKLIPKLAPGGRLIIGDIAFPNSASREKVKFEVGGDWKDEYYWQVDEAIPALANLKFKAEYIQVSRCTGIFTIHN
jgi:putative AdoMet-dependent methyltransferase